MAKDSQRWTLEDLIDFEQAAANPSTTSRDTRQRVGQAIRGRSGVDARRTGLHVWLEEAGSKTAGRKYASALSLVGGGLAALAFLAGISAVLGMLDRERGGINVPLFMAILIGGQWLVLLMAAAAWIFRRKTSDGFSAVQSITGKLARKFAGEKELTWWNRAMDTGGASRAAILWPLAGIAQKAGISFNLGIVCGLAGLVLVKHVGFYWETTTEFAMRSLMDHGVRILSAPWALIWAEAVPSAATIEASRWVPSANPTLPPGPSAWWEFLLMATLFWGLVPRLLLWVGTWKAGQNALAALDFQARHHRALWRELSAEERIQSDEKPLDGVLVLDVGGSGLAEKDMRPFLLQHMRVNPFAWQPIAVLDPAREELASDLLAGAPAGVVLMAEGWSLSPPRMIDLHAKIRKNSSAETPVKFLVANVAGDGAPAPALPHEKVEWENFVDSLRDPAAEVFFYEAPRVGL